MKNNKLKKRMMKISYFLVCILGGNRTKYLRKKNIFAKIGDNVLYQPKYLPNEPKLLKIHNNVRIAADVTFYTHDVINSIFSKMDKLDYQTHGSCIEILDNCFIGGKSIIVGNVKIGPNAIVGAGSVVTKDVPEGTIVAGNPAKVIGKFDELHQKRKSIDGQKDCMDAELRQEELWEEFNEKKYRRIN